MPDGRPNFDIGLVMAGAISAGAYTAGVMDFLIQALDSWQRAKEDGRADVPAHNVTIKVMAGASAGAITAAIATAIATAAFGGDITPVTERRPGSIGNTLYESWVRRIDIAELLGGRDLAESSAPVRSALDASELDAIAQKAIEIAPTGRGRAYIADPLHVILSVANLRGVPYAIRSGARQAFEYEMSAHADHVAFTASGNGRSVPGAFALDWLDYRNPNWPLLREAALASGAFPMGLKPRLLHRPAGDYDLRTWDVPFAPDPAAGGPLRCAEERVMPPAWPPRIAASPATTDYAYLCVDGGLMNNEPLELARRILAGPAGRNPRSGRAATRAILMIDPFPNVAPFSEDYAPKDDILAVFKGMFGALKNQARFKPDELVLAAEEDVYSCFMIAPRRKLADGSPSAFPMASNALGGFGGFLTEAFREHDFQLGRRNGQRFLQRHFCLPAAGADRNPLFDQWSATARSHHQFTEDGVTFLPIVPLIDGAATPIPSPAWPAFGEADLESLRGRVAKRVELVTGRLTDQYVKNWAARTLVRGVLLMKRGSLVDDIMETIRKSLADTGLLAGTVAPRARIDDFITVPHE